jgi:hypothetical protein
MGSSAHRRRRLASAAGVGIGRQFSAVLLSPNDARQRAVYQLERS